jgi:DNA-binding beta-propeller fold protein YncE
MVSGEGRIVTGFSRCKRLVQFGLAALPIIASGCGFSEPTLSPLVSEPLTRIVVPPADGKTAAFDIMALDQRAQRLYVADALDQGVDVIDVSASPGRYVETIHLQANPKGLVFVEELNRLFTGNDDSTVSVINADLASPHPYAVLATITTNGKGAADLLDYDPHDRKLYVTNPDDGFLSSINLVSGTVTKQIPNLGFLQQPRYDPADGMVYVVSADRNSIFQIDPSRDEVVREHQLPVVCEPHGLAINPSTNEGLIGCNDKVEQLSLAWDFKSQRMIGTFDLAGAGDAVIFNERAQHFYFAASSFNPPEIAVFNAAPITFLTAVPTARRSKSVAYDEAHQLIYTFDGKHLEAALWAFRDPVAGCFGAEAQRAIAGASHGETPNCHPAAALWGP